MEYISRVSISLSIIEFTTANRSEAGRNFLYIASDTLALISPTKLRVLDLPVSQVMAHASEINDTYIQNLVNLCLSNIHAILFQESSLENQNRVTIDDHVCHTH
jgi:hypothetical protein